MASGYLCYTTSQDGHHTVDLWCLGQDRCEVIIRQVFLSKKMETKISTPRYNVSLGFLLYNEPRRPYYALRKRAKLQRMSEEWTWRFRLEFVPQTRSSTRENALLSMTLRIRVHKAGKSFCDHFSRDKANPLQLNDCAAEYFSDQFWLRLHTRSSCIFLSTFKIQRKLPAFPKTKQLHFKNSRRYKGCSKKLIFCFLWIKGCYLNSRHYRQKTC